VERDTEAPSSALTAPMESVNSGITMVSQWCHSGVTVVLQWCHSGVTVVSQLFLNSKDGPAHRLRRGARTGHGVRE
jgi:hypothetical protein